MTALDTIAAYVNEVANGNTSIITLAGFETTSDIAHAAPQLEKILVITVKVTNVYGQVIIETPAIKDKGVTGYALILVSGTPLNVENFDDDTLDITASEGQKIIICLSKGKRKVVNGLNSNLTYYGYMYAINATGVSPLSDGIRVKCI
jgi:hypothetical protein